MKMSDTAAVPPAAAAAPEPTSRPASPASSQGENDFDPDPPNIISLATSFVASRFANHDPSHDMHHVRRVTLLALRLARCPSLAANAPAPASNSNSKSDSAEGEGEGENAPARGVDLLVVELSALFHDLCDRKYLPEGSASGEGKGAVTARDVLAPFWADVSALAGEAGESLDACVSAAQRERVERIVDNVSWSKDEARRRARAAADARESEDHQLAWERSTPEFQVVSDADRLDAIGSIGILRCAAFSAVKNRPLHVPPANPAMDSRPPAEQGEGYNGSCVAHFHEKLLRIRGERLWTEMAREEAERRQGMMEYFLAELDLEWEVAARGAELSLLQGLA